MSIDTPTRGAAGPFTRDALSVRSSYDELAAIRAMVLAHARERLDDTATEQLALAVHEAAANSIEHAHGGDAAKLLECEVETYADRVVVRVYDWGPPFQSGPADEPNLDGMAEGGFGLYIIGECVDEARRFRDERGRNCIALTKHAGGKK
ncbi:MAG: ATP-binding protein [Armatimonadetes bacterium]|nr:ATP-binding protein [Armatimonadota bacterium]